MIGGGMTWSPPLNAKPAPADRSVSRINLLTRKLKHRKSTPQISPFVRSRHGHLDRQFQLGQNRYNLAQKDKLKRDSGKLVIKFRTGTYFSRAGFHLE